MSRSARLNFGIPDSEYIVEVDESGAATSCYNQDTQTEYVGGGGGGGDFSTAEVTFNTTESESVMVYGIVADISSGLGSTIPTANAVTTFDNTVSNNDSLTVVLYQGNAYIATYSAVPTVVSGDASVTYYADDECYLITVTGDCTISLSSE